MSNPHRGVRVPVLAWRRLTLEERRLAGLEEDGRYVLLSLLCGHHALRTGENGSLTSSCGLCARGEPAPATAR